MLESRETLMKRTPMWTVLLVSMSIAASNCGPSAEARRVAARILDGKVIECSASAFTENSEDGRVELVEIRDFGWHIESTELSEAERLNGQEFDGAIVFEYSAARSTAGGRKCWKEWRASRALFVADLFFPSWVKIEKRGGTWTAGESDPYRTLDNLKAPADCSVAKEEHLQCP